MPTHPTGCCAHSPALDLLITHMHSVLAMVHALHRVAERAHVHACAALSPLQTSVAAAAS